MAHVSFTPVSSVGGGLNIYPEISWLFSTDIKEGRDDEDLHSITEVTF